MIKSLGDSPIAKSMWQLIRYASVGLVSNAVGYMLYLWLTYAGMGHKGTMSLLFGVGMAQTFYFNRVWTFGHDGKPESALVRYVTIYGLGYLFNLVILMMLVDHWGWPHQWVQAGAVFAIAAFLFLAQKLWVFAPVTRKNET